MRVWTMRRRGPLYEADIRRFYDWFGRWQDWQLYEERALNALIVEGEFGHAYAIFELGCGTARLAGRLLRDHLPSDATYRGIDISPTMVCLARSRLQQWRGRATVDVHNGACGFGEKDQTFDRVIAAYVLDLLSAYDSRAVLHEAQRVLRNEGRLCLVTLTHGTTPISSAVSTIWQAAYDIDPRLVGGCRPLGLRNQLVDSGWRIRYDAVLTAFGISSNVLVADAPAG